MSCVALAMASPCDRSLSSAVRSCASALLNPGSIRTAGGGADGPYNSTMVKLPSPRSAAPIAPLLRIENTMIGIRFSRASANAVASMTLRSCVDRLGVGQPLVAPGALVVLGIGAVHAVDVGGLEHRLGAQLGGAQDRGRIGGEERIAGTSRQHQACARLEMPRGPALLVGLADFAAWPAPSLRAPARRRPRARPRARGRS